MWRNSDLKPNSHKNYLMSRIKWSLTKPNSPNKVYEDDDARYKPELNEAQDAIDAIRKFDLESDNDGDRHMVDAPIAKKIPSQPNKSDSLADHFVRLNSRLDSMDVQLITYGEQFRMLNS